MFKYIILIFILTTWLNVNSQNVTISGYVVDTLSGESVIGANIYINNTTQSTLSNEYGFYSISSNPADSIEIVIIQPNYHIRKIKVSAQKTHVENLFLKSKDILIGDIIVVANTNFEPEISTNTIPIQIAQKLPSVGGESDIMKIFRLMPGVQSAENKSSLLVRGGSDDQNLIIIDDVPLYYINHLGGFVSVFNTDALKDAKLIKGGFPAHYGNRLSSVFDIRMKDGNLNNYKKQISIGILSTKFSFEGPIEKNKSSFIISARRFNLDLISRPLTYFLNDKVQGGYNFYDLNIKLNRKINDKKHIFFSLYSGNDKFFVSYSDADNLISKYRAKSEQISNWGNLLFAFRYNHIINANFFSNTTLSYTQYRNNNSLSFKEIEENKTVLQNLVSFNSGIKDIRLNTDFQHFTTQNYKLQFGASLIVHLYTPGKNHFLLNEENNITIDTSFNDNNLIGYETNLYLENKIKTGRLKSNFGARLNYFFINNKGFVSFEPRINSTFKLSESIQITASFAKMKQNIHLLTFASTGMPMNIWIPATTNEIPEKSLQFTLGLNKNFNKKYSISVEGYYKLFKNLITLKSASILFSSNQNFMNYIETNGKGTSYGIEFLAQKQTGKIQAWVAYTFSKTSRQFDNINHGISFPFDYDRTHNLSIVGIYNITKNISFSANWEYGTGFPFTFSNQKYLMNYNYIYSFDEKNGLKMEDFHKLDISIQFSRERKNKFQRTWSIDLYNVYNRKNPTFYILKTVEENNQFIDKLFKVSMFPFIPSISYSIKF